MTNLVTDLAAINTAIAGKAPTVHTHTTAQITGLDAAQSAQDAAIATKATPAQADTSAANATASTAYAAKGAIVDNDTISGFDSAASNGKVRWTWAVIKEAARAFVAATANQFTARQTLSRGVAGGMATATAGNDAAIVINNTPGAAMLAFHNGSFAGYFGIDTDNQLKIGGWSFGANAYKLLHEGLSGLFSFGATLFIKQSANPTTVVTNAAHTPPVTGAGNIQGINTTGTCTVNAPGAGADGFTMVLVIWNAAIANVTLAGFAKVTGDTLPTAAGGLSFVYITRAVGYTTAHVDKIAG